MIRLLKKEFILAIHPTVFIFWVMSAMLLIPNYPYYVVFFYSSLGIFFVCLSGRENHDIEYSAGLPVRKEDIVSARVLFAVIIELIQMVIAIPFAALREMMPLPGNQVGMDANIAFFGLSLVMFGLFNLLFFTKYYRSPEKVGKIFALCGSLIFVYIAVAETLAHVLPFFRDKLDTPDPQFLCEKLIVLLIGAAIYAVCTFAAIKVSQKRFARIDL